MRSSATGTSTSATHRRDLHRPRGACRSRPARGRASHPRTPLPPMFTLALLPLAALAWPSAPSFSSRCGKSMRRPASPAWAASLIHVLQRLRPAQDRRPTRLVARPRPDPTRQPHHHHLHRRHRRGQGLRQRAQGSASAWRSCPSSSTRSSDSGMQPTGVRGRADVQAIGAGQVVTILAMKQSASRSWRNRSCPRPRPMRS